MVIYNGEHAVRFLTTDMSTDKNTWEDWFMVPTSRPTMSEPGAQNKFVEIPGMSGSYDISDYLSPDIAFTDRSGSLEFIIDHDRIEWLTVHQKIATYLHGQKMRMILTDDPGWYYEGRFTINDFKSDQKYSRITIDYRVAPFKISIYADFAEDILWDPFCFERDDDWSVFYHMSVSGTSTHNITSYGARSKVSVRLVSGGPVTATFGGVTKTISTVGSIQELGNSNQIGTTPLTLSGNGVVDVGWRKLSL